MRLDRNGIKILDPRSEDNKLPKRCRPQDHEFRQVKTETSGYDQIYDVTYERVYYVCHLCGARDTRDRIDA